MKKTYWNRLIFYHSIDNVPNRYKGRTLQDKIRIKMHFKNKKQKTETMKNKIIEIINQVSRWITVEKENSMLNSSLKNSPRKHQVIINRKIWMAGRKVYILG